MKRIKDNWPEILIALLGALIGAAWGIQANSGAL